MLEGAGLSWLFYFVNKCREISPKELFFVTDMPNKKEKDERKGWEKLF